MFRFIASEYRHVPHHLRFYLPRIPIPIELPPLFTVQTHVQPSGQQGTPSCGFAPSFGDGGRGPCNTNSVILGTGILARLWTEAVAGTVRSSSSDTRRRRREHRGASLATFLRIARTRQTHLSSQFFSPLNVSTAQKTRPLFLRPHIRTRSRQVQVCCRLGFAPHPSTFYPRCQYEPAFLLRCRLGV